jgi:hypothetical protein
MAAFSVRGTGCECVISERTLVRGEFFIFVSVNVTVLLVLVFVLVLVIVVLVLELLFKTTFPIAAPTMESPTGLTSLIGEEVCNVLGEDVVSPELLFDSAMSFSSELFEP